MSYIAPNSDIYLIEKCNLRPNMGDTYYFSDANDQYNFFIAKALYHLTEQSYVRINEGVIRVEKSVEDCYKVNYLMYRNTSFENKWFYAFITGEPKYINNTTTELTFDIDVLQTWMFSYTINPCFVERNHVSDDTIGLNIIAENIDAGSPVVLSEENTFSGFQLGCVITSKPLPTLVRKFSDTSFNWYYPLWEIQADPASLEYKLETGQANTLYIYPNIPLSPYDFNRWKNQYPITINENYYARDALGNLTGGVLTLTELMGSINTFYSILSNMPYDFYYDMIDNRSPFDSEIIKTRFTTSDIIIVYQYPLEFALPSWTSRAATYYPSSQSMGQKMFYSNIPTNVGKTYVPNNNKLYTYPYSYCEVTDNEGNSKKFFNEYSEDYDITGKKRVDLNLTTSYTFSPSASIFPMNYKGENARRDESFAMNSFIQCCYLNNAYRDWWTANAQKLSLQMLQGAIGAGLSIIGSPNISQLISGGRVLGDITNYNSIDQTTHTHQEGVVRNRIFELGARGGRGAEREGYRREPRNDLSQRVYTDPQDRNETRTISQNKRSEKSVYSRQSWDAAGIVEKFNNITNTLANVAEAGAQENNGINQAALNLINTGIQGQTYTIKRIGLRDEIAYRIDKYFDSFGYQINRVTVPNTNVRKYWTYVKTTDMTIRLIDNIPNADCELICKCYNSGIRFWTRADGSDIGDFNLVNEKIGVVPPAETIKFFTDSSMSTEISMTPVFSTNVYNYTLNTEFTSLTIYINFAYTSIEINGNHIPSAGEVITYPFFHEGNNTVTVRANQTYNITVVVPQIAVSPVIYDQNNLEILYQPIFNLNAFSYSANATTSVIRFTPNLDITRCTFNGEIQPLQTSYTFTLNPGNNLISILYGSNYYGFSIVNNIQPTYGVNFYTNQALTDPLNYTPAFDPNITSYTATTYTGSDPYVFLTLTGFSTIQSVVVNGTNAVPIDDVYELLLRAGDNYISITANYKSYLFLVEYQPS